MVEQCPTYCQVRLTVDGDPPLNTSRGTSPKPFGFGTVHATARPYSVPPSKLQSHNLIRKDDRIRAPFSGPEPYDWTTTAPDCCP